MNKSVASLLAVGDQIIATKASQINTPQSEWERLIEAAAAELGDELAAMIGPVQKGFHPGNGSCLFMVQVRPFGCSSILIAFFRGQNGDWSIQDPRGIGAYRVCNNYVWSESKNKPSSQSFVLVDNLPEAIALCDAQTGPFKAVKKPEQKLGDD